MAENTLETIRAAATAALNRRARNAVILDLREFASFTKFFVICSGISDTQIEGISEAILEELEENWNERPWHREGGRNADWILLDYVDFVVHVFLDEKRDYYNLERLWADAPQIEVPDVEASAEYSEDDEEFDELEDYPFDEETSFPSDSGDNRR
ncbi:MAG: ribosome silencing factor [Candidatus Poribacteria bacterium]|nr:ribosome silencing factor [Candidatus Poribacteria bacterium]